MSGGLVVVGTLTLPGVPGSVAHARRFLRDMVPQHPLLDDLVTVGSETVSNAIAHTDSGDGGRVTISLLEGGGVYRLEVCDDGAGGRRPHIQGETLAEAGRGLRVVEALSGSWGFRTDGPRTVVWAEFRNSSGNTDRGLSSSLQDAGPSSVRRRRSMSIPAYNTVAWFQVGTDAPEEARRFYGDMFGWRIETNPDGDGYDLVRYPGTDVPSGGISHEADASGRHVMFMVMVEDVDAVCAETEKHGGKVALPTVTVATGLKFAYLQDPSGNKFGVFTPA